MNNQNKQPMPVQDAKERIKNFNEVALGYSVETALIEAQRCLDCKKAPCMQGCPVEVNIPAFIREIKEGNFDAAIHSIKEKNSLPAICGRVCPQETQCEQYCVRGKQGEPVAIGRLERFVADYELNQKADQGSDSTGAADKDAASAGRKVAVIGSGPAGLTCAADLAKKGYDVTIFESLHAAGGVLIYGIPEFRLPKAIVKQEIANLQQLGVKIKTNSVIGRLYTVDELLEEEGFEAVFLGTGAGLPRFMGISGENLCGVYSANEFLTRSNLMKGYLFPEYATPIKVGAKVAVCGAGNVAMDAARTALRLGAEEVTIVYRRSRAEAPARIEEIAHAEEEGVRFAFLTCPTELIGDENGWIKQMKCLRYELGESDASGRRRPVAIEGSEFIMDIDTLVMAIGTGANPLVGSTTKDLELNKKGYIVADETTGATSRPGVYAGGDIVTGAATVILAMGAGKQSAKAIDEYLQQK